MSTRLEKNTNQTLLKIQALIITHEQMNLRELQNYCTGLAMYRPDLSEYRKMVWDAFLCKKAGMIRAQNSVGRGDTYENVMDKLVNWVQKLPQRALSAIKEIKFKRNELNKYKSLSKSQPNSQYLCQSGVSQSLEGKQKDKNG